MRSKLLEDGITVNRYHYQVPLYLPPIYLWLWVFGSVPPVNERLQSILSVPSLRRL